MEELRSRNTYEFRPAPKPYKIHIHSKRSLTDVALATEITPLTDYDTMILLLCANSLNETRHAAVAFVGGSVRNYPHFMLQHALVF